LKNSLSQLNKAYEICQKETQKWAKTFYLGHFYYRTKKEKRFGRFTFGAGELMK
jgi:phytoene synthase